VTVDQLISRLMRARSEGASGRSRVVIWADHGFVERDVVSVSLEARGGEPVQGDEPPAVYLETEVETKP
jgi:hypothetical protein